MSAFEQRLLMLAHYAGSDAGDAAQKELIAEYQGLVDALKANGRVMSITGWHRHDCPHVQKDMDDPCSPLCTRQRDALDRAGELR